MLQLIACRAAEFDGVYDRMVESFPLDERRDREDARALLADPRYRLCHIEEGGRRVGFVAFFLLCGVTFVEHLSIDKSCRGKGLGTRVLSLLAEKGNLVLEVELPLTEEAKRRIAFYERAGFFQNEYPYAQPAYRATGCPVPMILMSYPGPLESPPETAALLYREIYGASL